MQQSPLDLQFFNMYLADSKVHLLNHFKSLLEVAYTKDVEANINCKDFIVTLTSRFQTVTLYPQFLKIDHNGPGYTKDFTHEVVCFIGWRPYISTAIAAFTNKLEIKKKLLEGGFLTPDYSTEINYDAKDVIVKKIYSSFGKHLHGPFQSAQDYPLQSENGEYYEKFINGTIAKIAFWNEHPVYIELQDMPELEGDGKSTILELAQNRATQRARQLNEYQLDEVIDYQNKSLESILAKGEKILADFRYESDCSECYSVQEIPLPHPAIEHISDLLHRLGKYLFSLIQKEDHPYFYYGADAILTATGELWVLEVNANPTVHQCVYPIMLKNIM
jgi:hypothetical protein